MADDSIELELEEQIREATKTQAGEWSICAALVFLGVILVLLIGTSFDNPQLQDKDLELASVVEGILKYPFTKDLAYFPIDLAILILLTSIMSSFCALISLVADKNNRNTWIVRMLTLGPIIPIFITIVMVMIIVNDYDNKSILQEFIGGETQPIIKE